MHSTSQNPRPVGFLPLGVFFFLGSVMAAYAAITLLKPGTFLDRGWALNRTAHTELASLGKMVAAPFGVLAVVLSLAGVGWLRRRYWGWLLSVSLIAANLAGNVAHLALGDWLRSGVGVVIAGLLLAYMIRPGVRTYFLPHLDALN